MGSERVSGSPEDIVQAFRVLAMQGHLKGMRVGQSKRLRSHRGLAPGVYEADVVGKRFRIEVSADSSEVARVERVGEPVQRPGPRAKEASAAEPGARFKVGDRVFAHDGYFRGDCAKTEPTPYEILAVGRKWAAYGLGKTKYGRFEIATLEQEGRRPVWLGVDHWRAWVEAERVWEEFKRAIEWARLPQNVSASRIREAAALLGLKLRGEP